MRLPQNDLHLSYCTNTHPSDGMAEVRDNLERYTVPVRDRLSPDRPLGVGLRLSAREAQELMRPGALEDFHAFLNERGLYVFTMNGFPYGAFHGEPVKSEVHAPDWRTEERVQYTLILARILAGLLPAGHVEATDVHDLMLAHLDAPGAPAPRANLPARSRQ